VGIGIALIEHLVDGHQLRFLDGKTRGRLLAWAFNLLLCAPMWTAISRLRSPPSSNDAPAIGRNSLLSRWRRARSSVTECGRYRESEHEPARELSADALVTRLVRDLAP
jgi:hypothetical protein